MTPVSGRRTTTEASVPRPAARAAQIQMRKKSLADPVQAARPPAAATPITPPMAAETPSPRRIRNTAGADATVIAIPTVTGSGSKEMATGTVVVGFGHRVLPGSGEAVVRKAVRTWPVVVVSSGELDSGKAMSFLSFGLGDSLRSASRERPCRYGVLNPLLM
ncbi:hypothetical protein Nans01_14460 [Nocardiopsis ansamitocini]|uniref:Uncharacterized protein n=1 Tax=Nocardiopsis ansamitocini TaxID=1670832 RepID=A0A9W6P4C6_9ACTN|nr:hypothetical protein Nans01_14460 [Nocardiopsis ansamitocini]